MEEKTVCKKCGFAGERKLVPYKIIANIDGESVRFVGQICERCFEEIFGRPPTEKDFDFNVNKN